MQERSELHKVGLDTIALHPSQALVATGGADRLIKLWPCHSRVRGVSTLVRLVQRMQNLPKRLSCTKKLSYMQWVHCAFFIVHMHEGQVCRCVVSLPCETVFSVS